MTAASCSLSAFPALFAIVLLLVGGAPTAALYVREEPKDENYLTGFFTWDAATQKGSVAWDPEAPTADPGGPTEPTDAVEKAKVSLSTTYVQHVVTPNPFRRPPIEFSSQPIPHTLFLNASRLLRVNLYITGCSGYSGGYYGNEPQFSVEIRVGDGLLTGSHYETPISYVANFGDATPPKVPSGHCYRAFRMPAEMDVLPAGTILRVRIIPETQSVWHRFGTSQDHRSILEIPFFPPEEAVFRFPELRAGPGEPGADADAAGMAFAALVGTLPHARRPGRRAMVAAALAAALVGAGCLGATDEAGPGTDEPGRAGSAKSSIISDADNASGLTNASSGSLAGVVHDDLNLPLASVHAALQGTDRFATTNKLGQFTIPGLSPGMYQLRLDRQGFRSFEDFVQIVNGSVTRLDVTMQAIDAGEGDFRAHRHDRWGGLERVVVMEKTLEHQVLMSEQFVLGYGHERPFPLAPPGVILPGTRFVEVEVTWQMSWLQRVTLSFRSNIEQQAENETILHAREKGVPFKIAATWEMADRGHNEASAWGNFWIRPAIFDAKVANVAQRAAEPNVFTVKITLVKGVVPYEPAHLDYWEGRDEIVVLDAGSRQCCSDEHYRYTGWRPVSIVPPGTEWLEITLKQSRQAVRDIQLLARPANMNENTAGKDYRPLTPKSQDTLSKSYELELKPEEADAFYAPLSNWFFLSTNPSEATHGTTEFVEGLVALGIGPNLLTLTVVAHRTPL